MFVEGDTKVSESDPIRPLRTGRCYQKLDWGKFYSIEFMDTRGDVRKFQPQLLYDPTLEVVDGKLKLKDYHVT